LDHSKQGGFCKVDGQQMFLDQKYTIEGDLELMIELFAPKEE
jgi:hypothetical protein